MFPRLAVILAAIMSAVEAALVAGASPRLTEFFAAGDLPLTHKLSLPPTAMGLSRSIAVISTACR